MSVLKADFLGRYNETTAKVNAQAINEAETIIGKGIADFTQEDAISYSKAISHSGKLTQNRKLSTASAYCKYLMARDAMVRNPFDIVRRPKKDRMRTIRWLRSEDRDRLLDETHDPMVKAILACGLSGLRLAEIVSLNVEQLFDGRLWNVEGKGDKVRTIPLTNEVDAILTEYTAGLPKGPMFTTRSGRISRRTVENYVYRASEQILGLHIAPHALRHTFVTLGVKADIPIAKMAAIVGHASPLTTQLYTHLDDDDLRDALRVLDKPVDKPKLRLVKAKSA